MLDEICSADPGEPAQKFARQLGQVLFAHVPVADRLGTANLDELIEARSEAIDERFQALRADLGVLNHEIAETERRLRPDRRLAVEQRLALLRRKLGALTNAEPTVPGSPDGAVDPAFAARIDDLRAKISQCDLEIEGLRTEDARLALDLDSGVQLRTALDTLAQQVAVFRQTHATRAVRLGLSLDDLLQVIVTRTPLETAINNCASRRDQLRTLLDISNVAGPAGRRRLLESGLAEAVTLLDQPAREYAAAIASHQNWEGLCAELIQGSGEEPGIERTEAELDSLTNAPAVLTLLRKDRDGLVRKIHDALGQKVGIYEELYRPARDFIEEHPLAQACNLAFGASLREQNLEQRFFDLLSRGVVGTFTGLDEGSEMLRSLVSSTDFSSADEVVAFVVKLDTALHEDLRSMPPTNVDPERAVRSGHTIEEIYDLVFGLAYLEPYHSLRYQGISIDRLSPGEKGTLLLVFYLLVDPARTPILLDQPDENLDNQTIKDMLVPAIKEAAGRRQVIVVTHNPNVAIVADADQLIVANRDGEVFSYSSGAIEDGPINLNAVDVLEGTWPALDNRTLKYQRPDI